MAMVLDKVVPFGRSLHEYQLMFNLTPADLAGHIVGVGDGPASFNAEATRQGYRVTSVDPIYCFNGAEIKARFDAVVDNIINQVKATPNDWVWSVHPSPDGLRANRERVMATFLDDYAVGLAQGRYIMAELPHLPLRDRQFSLALCSHLLFLYSDQLDYHFHWQSIQDMLRIAPEVRIFPLLTLMLQRSPHLDPILEACQARGYVATVQSVPYELQRGGNQMLVIQSQLHRE